VQERNGRLPEAKAGEAAPLLAFPTAFPIKIMGRRESGFASAVIEILLRHAPDFLPGTLESRPSRQGTYVSLTATVNATSQEQIDALYRELCDHPSVVMVL
jgi:uncharacterized protein